MSLSYCENCAFQFFSQVKPSRTTEDIGFDGMFVVLCKNCLERFAVPTISPFGIRQLEELELCTLEYKKLKHGPVKGRLKSRYVRTGVKIIAPGVLHPILPMVDFGSCTCPVCKVAGSLVHELGDAICPQCQRGPLKVNFDVE